MTLNELVSTITAKDYLFEIAMEGKQFKRKSVSEVLTEYDTLTDYFKKIAEIHNTNKLGVLLFAKNGTSFIRKGFFLVEISTVENAVETSTIPLIPPFNHNPMDTNSQILQIKLDMLAERAEELKQRNKDLERKNDELFTENTRLIRENGITKDKYELEFKSKEFDLKKEQSGGLNGVMETVKTLPAEAWQFLAGLIPNHPMGKQAASQQEAIGEIEQHTNSDAQVYIDSLVSILQNQPLEVVAMVSMVAESLINKPNSLKAIYLKFFPSISTENPKTEEV